MAKQQISEHEWLYTGAVHEQAAAIKGDGLLVAPTPYLFLRRLELRGQENKAAEAFNWYVHTSDAFAYSCTGAFTLVRDFWNQYDLQKIGKFGWIDRRFYLNQGAYQEIDRDGLSISFSRGEHLLNRDVSLSNALRHGVWQAAVRHPLVTRQTFTWSPLLLEQYARRLVFPQFEQAMSVYVHGTPKRDELWSFFVCRLVGSRRSRADGDACLGVDNGRLVGVAPEALEAARRRSFELCERLSGEAYPALARERRIGEGRLEAGQRGVGSAVIDEATPTKTQPSMYPSDPYAWVTQIQPYTDDERAANEAGARRAKEEEQAHLVRSFKINREMKREKRDA